jgi:hypothetical protein
VASSGETLQSACVVFSFGSIFLILSTRLFAAYSERDSNSNSCSTRWLRFYGKMPSHESNPFPHTDQPNPGPSIGILRIKPCPGVRNAQIDVIAMTRKLHLGFPRTAVLDDVSQCFLNNSKEAKSHLLRDHFVYVMMNKLNVEAVLS